MSAIHVNELLGGDGELQSIQNYIQEERARIQYIKAKRGSISWISLLTMSVIWFWGLTMKNLPSKRWTICLNRSAPRSKKLSRR